MRSPTASDQRAVEHQTARRLKVLLSAYACEPFKGSEPADGWHWATEMARFHDVWVLTRAQKSTKVPDVCARDFHWSVKAERMNRFYQQTASRSVHRD